MKHGTDAKEVTIRTWLLKQDSACPNLGTKCPPLSIVFIVKLLEIFFDRGNFSYKYESVL